MQTRMSQFNYYYSYVAFCRFLFVVCLSMQLINLLDVLMKCKKFLQKVAGQNSLALLPQLA